MSVARVWGGYQLSCRLTSLCTYPVSALHFPRYNDVLRQLILQGMYTLDENIVTVRCRDVDKSDCEREMKAACAEFTSSTGRKVSLNLPDRHRCYMPRALSLTSVCSNPSDHCQDQ